MTPFREVRRVFRLTHVNRKTLFAIELVFKLVAAALLIAAYSRLMNLSMDLTGYEYLTRESLPSFIFHPLTIAFTLVWAAFALTWALIDLGAVVYVQDASRHGIPCRVEQALAFAIRNAFRAWRLKNLPLIALFIGFLPILSIGIGIGMATGFSIPEIVEEAVRNNKMLFAGIGAALLLIPLMLSRWMFAFHAFTLDGVDFKTACARTRQPFRRCLGNYALLLAAQLVYGGAVVLCEFVMALAARGLGKALVEAYSVEWLPEIMTLYAVLLVLVIAFAMAMPYTCLWVAAMYNGTTDRTAWETPAAKARGQRLRTVRVFPALGKHRKLLVRLMMAAMLIGAALLLISLIRSGELNPRVESLRVVEITAHRGASRLYPENTMAAFRGAWELGADWVELDVQQTMDGRIVVMHDPNTRRTTGVNGYIWNMTYDEVAALDAGSRFSREFAGEPIPLLSEVAEFARQTGVRLNIELKPTGHETDFEQGVIDIIREYGIEDRVVITSQVYRVLINVKAIDESIATVYVTSFAYGAIDRLTAADHYSVEATSATRRLVSHAHNNGSQVYAWTVNTRRGIHRMIDRNVDNIITDNVALARQCVTESHYSNLLSDFIKTLDRAG